MVGWKRGALSQKLDDCLEFLQILASLSHAFDIAGKLLGLGDFLHFSQSLNIASNDSNSWMSSPRRLFFKAEAVSLFGMATEKGRPPRRDICL